MTESFARRERRELCDLAHVLGPDAPTLCEGWTSSDLMAHLVVRERRPVASVGGLVPRLSGLVPRAMARQQAQGYEVMVERYRTPAPFLRALPPVDELVNGLELLVHHEDLRRGGDAWEPRELTPADLDLIWTRLTQALGLLGRRIPVPTVVKRADTGATAVARKGEDPVTVTAPVVELVLFLFGRTAVRDLSYDGPEDRVARLRSARLGI
jgi:uncharacterized protein (TIGR03085 family)